jgi:hypothetical protein
MMVFQKKRLQRCLQVAGPRKELTIASLGCLLGSTLLLLAVQLYQDINHYLEQNEGPKNYFTMNKKVEGGALVNLGKKDESFSPEELQAIQALEGVKRIGGFKRNQFPVTVYIWPTGKVGLGSAAKADLFFESIPDAFLDFVPKEWKWEENASLVPIMVPKFYLDLWNFGLAPSRVEYPSLSTEAATGMPIEIFIGRQRTTTLDGRFVAFSKRINSVLVPESFLAWANKKFAEPAKDDFFFLWKDSVIDGPPRSRSQLLEMVDEPAFSSWEISPLGDPAKKVPASSLLSSSKKKPQPSRIILEIMDTPSAALLQFIEENHYELNREFPEQDLFKKALLGLFLGAGLIGGTLSLLSIATFSSSFRLMITRSADYSRNLLLLGFSCEIISQVFLRLFLQLFFSIITISLLASYAFKYFLIKKAASINFHIPSGFSAESLLLLGFYGLLFTWLKQRIIRKSVSNLL